MKFVFGNQQKALSFLRDITEKDSVAVFSHIDTDGFVSGFLADKTLQPVLIEFLDYALDLVKHVIDIVKEKNINKVVFTDLNLQQNLEDLKKLAEICKVFVIDHHQYNENVNRKNMIFMLTPSTSCTGYTIYNLLIQIDRFRNKVESYDWLVASAVIADYTFEQNKEFVNAIEDKYHCKNKAINQTQAYSSDLGMIATTINDAAIYFYDDREKFYSLFKKIEKIDDMKHIEIYAKDVQKEITKALEDFEKNCLRKEDLMLHVTKLHFPVTSAVTSILSGKYTDKTIIFLAESDARDYVKISSRRQDGKVNLPELLQKATQGLQNATAGGHFKAAGGSILKEDIEKFKKRLMELV